MFNIQTFCAAAFAAALATPSMAADVGVRQISLTAAPTDYGRDLHVTVWYPAEGGGEPVMIGANRVFEGAPAVPDAPPAKGRFPLVVLSHGSGSRVQGMSWLATELAEAGFVVAGPNHPGTTSGYSTPGDTPKLWQRTADLSAVIDRLTGDGQWQGLVDADRIGVVGFSLGGAAAMLSVGARADLEAYARYCDAYEEWDCAWYAGGIGYVNDARVKVGKVDLRTIDKELFQQSNLDRRIKSAVLVDPGLARAYDAQSLKEISIPMSFINLGSAGTVPPGVIADRLATLTPNGTYAAVADAVHYSFLPECREGAAEILRSSGEDEPICEDGGARSRADIHAELVRLIRGDLERTLKDGR
ncbi:alpha/beta hydrolase family protein [Aquamicrobium defluvii]|uniref:Dienelactone hydrolase n=1 Tax=Aquamicrobium defluvii TaxID=69279 RepID=A0A011TG17_9HYPH|nr:alpha/beta hydrolase [Aquamicrobium defluvii]EXL02847.1 dienelactone hydrolase [Aquamicrobium defluvii]EZQ13331.1 dienelactone hydrolase [Halopseudomonas bauzanensis]TDR33244.1 putative dienelactone hydrolase [Aquamicrobium defluvii]